MSNEAKTTPIRAALEAAALAADREDDRPGSDFASIAAATVAAFLRALPDQYTRGGAAFWDAIPAQEETRLWLADAVEREAANV